MRIRNRKVPFPLSSLSPVPLSDPLLQPHNCIADGPNPSDYPSKHPQNKQHDNPNSGEDEEGQEWKSNDNREKTMLGAKTVTNSLHQGEKKRREPETMTAARNHKKKKSESGAKKRVRGGAVMEGSRCSRVNGRGWRCCQPTLVGYSLCEHHLGKGRLRSMASVPMEPGPVGEEKKLLMSKRKHKLGMVKARSMRSLLGQPNNATISIAENDE